MRKRGAASTRLWWTRYPEVQEDRQTVLGIVRSFFARISRVPEAAQIKVAMRREESTQAKALADVAAAADKATKAVAALEDPAIKALTGEAALDLGIINQLMPKPLGIRKLHNHRFCRLRAALFCCAVSWVVL